MKKFNFKKIAMTGMAAMMAVSAMGVNVFAENSATEMNLDSNTNIEEILTFDENGEPILPEGWLSAEEMQEKYNFTITEYTGESAKAAESKFAAQAAGTASLNSTNAILTDSYTSNSNTKNSHTYYLPSYTNITLDFESASGTSLYSPFYMTASGVSTLGYSVETTDSSTKKAKMYLVGSFTQNGTTSNGIIATLTVPAGGSAIFATMDISNASINIYSSIVNSTSATKTGYSTLYAR